MFCSQSEQGLKGSSLWGFELPGRARCDFCGRFPSGRGGEGLSLKEKNTPVGCYPKGSLKQTDGGGSIILENTQSQTSFSAILPASNPLGYPGVWRACGVPAAKVPKALSSGKDTLKQTHTHTPTHTNMYSQYGCGENQRWTCLGSQTKRSKAKLRLPKRKSL